jgi:hypothetical protein
MTNAAVAELRRIAADPRVSAMSRLHAIDTLAADANVYIVKADDGNPRRWDTTSVRTEYCPVGTRARRAVISLLRRLPESQRPRERLLFIRGEEFYRRGRVEKHEVLFRIKSPDELLKETPLQIERAITDPEISAALKHWREQNGEGDGNQSCSTEDEKQTVGCP